jgi:hypothetical protein
MSTATSATKERPKYGHVVVDGHLRFVSVSQLERFDMLCDGGCERKWWFRYVAREKEEQKAPARMGEMIHAQIEHYLKTGEDVLGDVARAGKHLLPKPGKDLLVEQILGEVEGDRVVSCLEAAGVPVIGKIDLLHNRETLVDDEGDEKTVLGNVEVCDWKTTKNISDKRNEEGAVIKRGYAKTRDELSASWQMTGYGKVALSFFSANEVRLGHVYFQTEGQRRAEKRSQVVTANDIISRWRGADGMVEHMKSVARITSVEKTTANYDACSAYGGCPHRDKCPLDPKKQLLNMFGGKTKMGSLFSKLKETPKTQDVEVKNEIEKLKAEEVAAVGAPDEPEPAKIAEPIPETSSEKVPGVCAQSGKQVSLTVEHVATKKYTCSCNETLKIKPQKLGDSYAALLPTHGKDANVVTKVEEKPPAKAKSKSVDKQDQTNAPVSLVAPFTTHWYLLNVDEDHVAGQRLEDYARRIAREVEREAGVADYREIPYAQGAARIASAIRANPPPPGVYEVSSSHPLGMIAFNELAHPPARVFRGRGT